MLLELAVRNLGVIDDVSLVFGRGMTALTGETGAGKTLLVGAIGLLTGDRADAALVGPLADEAVVEGRFEDGEGNEVVLRRVVPRTGRSRAYVDGGLATAAELASRGAELVDIHGQHGHQALMTSRTQREGLDRFAELDLDPLAAARAEVQRLSDELESLGGDDRSRARELDLCRFQLEELERARLDDDSEDEQLKLEAAQLSDATGLAADAGSAIDSLTGEGGINDSLAGIIQRLEDRPGFEALVVRMVGLRAELDEIGLDLRSTAEGIEHDPARLESVQERLRTLTELRRKYGDDLATVIAEREHLRQRVAELTDYDVRAEQIGRDLDEARSALSAVEDEVRRKRVAAAPLLAAAVTERLSTLGMPKAVLEVSVGQDGAGDDVTYLLAANPGIPAQPLSRVASGGELARTMLALRLVLSEAPDSLLFDEVDAGIGGEAGAAVGGALADLGGSHQVLVVTHLPQVAAFADAHVAVRKDDVEGSTRSDARPLEQDERVLELTRMLSGVTDSSAAREHAAELLKAGRRA